LLACRPPVAHEWICFPDDDCWFPDDLLSLVSSCSKNLDYILGVIDTGHRSFPNNDGSGIPVEIGLQVALQNTASAALFISGECVNNFTFDERLGLGAKVGSAEDLDLVLHLIQGGFLGGYSTNVRVGHPYKPQRDREYF